jgi:DNA-binding response OmpR family regulator
VVIVDPRLDDYQCLAEPARQHLIRLTLTSSGASALRLAPSFADALWLVSPQLPDMNGLDLLEMLQSLQASLNAVVVDAAYDRERETRALALRAVQYVCKPVQLEWIEAWQGTPLANLSRAAPPLPYEYTEKSQITYWTEIERLSITRSISMNTMTLTADESYGDDNQERFQKITRRHKALMPTHSSHSAIKASHKTSGSRRASKQVSRRKGGMHHRRLSEFA